MWCKQISFLILFLPYFVTPEESFVYKYTPENFKTQVEQMDGNFIMFYAPWCRHCTEFHPIWQELAELVNTEDSRFAIAQVDCTEHHILCNENDITGYPSLLYFHKNTFQPVEYKGTRDLPSLTLFLSEAFTMKAEGSLYDRKLDEVRSYSGMAYLNDHNIERFLAKGQHFVMFYASWCKASQRLAPIWAELAVQYAHSDYLRIGKINCMESQATCANFDVKQFPYLLWIVNGRIVGIAEHEDTLEGLNKFVDKMMLAENHDPEQFMKKKKALPVARITEDNFDTFLQNEIVYINYYAPWCAYCMQLSPLWSQLGERFQNESRVIIADVDCGRSKDICSLEKINVLPTLVLYNRKKIVDTENGGKSLESLIALVQEQLGAHTKTESSSEGSANIDNDSPSPPLVTKDEL